ncbi:LSU ribosomal protein L25p [hydrothermal vent metagenome]|uniref:LSU ribosomal protein L25p n=1 Tax=hydrothermal vent metagenome TaxID=652676 RepID=A0A3B0YUD2_9ZZZZ
MSLTFELSATRRDNTGTANARRLRHTGKVPAIVYGEGKDPMTITLEHHLMLANLEHESFYTQILDVKCDGQSEKVVLKDLQRHPSKAIIMHMDFQRVSDTSKIKMHVPLHFIGEDIAPGVKQEGGSVAHTVNHVDVLCLAKDLPEFIEADVSTLNVGEALHLTDLKLPEGVELLALQQGADHNLTVAIISKPRGGSEEDDDTTVESAPEPSPSE